MSLPLLAKPKDRLFYGWVVVIAIFIITATVAGVFSSFGVFFKSLQSEFNLTRATTSVIASLSAVLSGIVGVAGGWALDKHGPKNILLLMGIFLGLSLLLTSQTSAAWQLFITYSVLLAIGTGPVYVVTVSTVMRWFDKKRGLAVGIASSGIGLGQVIMSPFAAFLISNYNWRIAYIVIGALAWLIVVPLSRFIKKDPYEIGALPDGARAGAVVQTVHDPGIEEKRIGPIDLLLPQILRTRSFWLFVSIWLTFSFCVLLVLTQIVVHTTDIGFNIRQASAMISFLGGAAIGGRVVGGIFADRMGRKKTAIILCLLQIGAMIWLISARELWALYLSATIFGFGNGGSISAITTLISETLGVRQIGTVLGILEIGWGMGSAAGPIVGGLIFDARNSYSLAFLIGAIALGIATILIALVRKEMGRSAQT